MASISDLPLRTLNHRYGCELAFVEMINARCLGYKSRKTQEMLSTNEQDRPLGVQLLGCEETYIRKALGIIFRYRFDVLDFNAACPERKVVRRGEGASLLKDPRKLHTLLSLVVKQTRGRVPVTVKIRSGWDAASINAVDVALACQDAGVAAVFIHGRTQQQCYSGTVDYRIIARVKKALRIPVIGSGDVFSAQLALRMIERTGCDAVLVARGMLGNPWIFRELKAAFAGKPLPRRPSLKVIADTMAEHLKLCVDFHGERVGVMVFRKFCIWYTWGMPSTRPLREKATQAKTAADVLDVIAAFKKLDLKGKIVRDPDEKIKA